jgi:hypothetical protein
MLRKHQLLRITADGYLSTDTAFLHLWYFLPFGPEVAALRSSWLKGYMRVFLVNIFFRLLIGKAHVS